MKLWKLASALAVFAVLCSASSLAARAADPENTMIITLKDGDVTIALDPTWRQSMSRRSRSWCARAPTTTSPSTASSTASWRRPATCSSAT